MANKGINYTSRNFADIRFDLINMVKQYYPDVFNDFNDASVGMMLLELNAAVGDMLSVNTDRMFQETQIDYAQERKSILSMARTFGLKVPGKSPSMTIVDFSVTLPVNGDTFDLAYAPTIRGGSQVTGSGKVFETLNDIDFSNPFSIGGVPNRLIIPNFNANGTLANYTLVKREIVINGYSRILKRVVTQSDVKPFLEVILPENNVLSIESVILLDGTNFSSEPSMDKFLDNEIRWFEVDSLAENKVFIEDNSQMSDNISVKNGKYITTNEKFMVERTDLGFTKLIFGSGTQDTTSLNNFGASSGLVNQIGNFINNLSLGSTLKANTTMFVKYRVGGGKETNLGPNTIKSLGIVNINVNGPNNNLNKAVRDSLKVNNLFPAIGGKDEPSIEELRHMVKYNFAAQNRVVTLKDYQTRISQMPGKYGVPFRCGVLEEQNKVKVYMLGLDSFGNLTNESTSTMKTNIATYLSDYKMLNDYIAPADGKIVNVSFEVDLYIDKKFAQSQIIGEVINEIKNYMSINNYQMGENIYMSPLIETINNVGGVINVLDIRIYNKFGGDYSLNKSGQGYIDFQTNQIDLVDGATLFGDSMTMHEIKYPNKDIVIRVK